MMQTVSKRVLVTGSSGFTGRYVVEALLAQGHEVFGIGSGATPGPIAPEHYYRLDLMDQTAVKACVQSVQPEWVIHLAAVAFVATEDISSFYLINVVGTRHLLDALKGLETPPSRVLLASSANVYGNASEGMLSEQQAIAPANDYAISKIAMEYLAHTYPLNIIITRPFNYTGVGQADNFLIPKIVSHFKRQASTIELGNLEVWREFNDVRYVAECYVDLLTQGVSATTVNVCTGAVYSLREVIDMCQEITGQTIKVSVNPKFVRANDIKTLSGNPAYLKSLINPALSPINLGDTLAWMLKHD